MTSLIPLRRPLPLKLKDRLTSFAFRVNEGCNIISRDIRAFRDYARECAAYAVKIEVRTAQGISQIRFDLSRNALPKSAPQHLKTVDVESHIDAVDKALKRLNFLDQDRKSVINALRNNPVSDGAAAIVARGHLETCEGYVKVVSALKSPRTRAAAVAELKLADILHGKGYDHLTLSESRVGRIAYDIDVGIRKPNSEKFAVAYQLKETTEDGLKRNASSITKQLKEAPADLKVGIIDVKSTPTEIDPGSLLSLATLAKENGIVFHLRFADSIGVTFPPNAAIIPA